MNRVPGLVLLLVLAAAYLRLALFIPISWTDEGVIVYPIWRVAVGELPYRDFQQLYGPSLFFLGGLAFRLFGSDLAVLRYLLLAVKAATCVMVYLGARRMSGRPFAFIAYALSVVLTGLIWPVSSVPYASFFGTALCIAGVLSFLALERRFLFGCAIAGLCFGLASTFKQTTGAFAFLALALYLLIEDGKWREPPNPIFAIVIRTSRWFVLLFTAAISIYYLVPRNSFWNLILLLSPILFLCGYLALRELRGESDPQRELRSFWGTITLSLAFLLPLACYGLYYASLGLADELLFNLGTGIPSALEQVSPFPKPTTTFVLWQLTCIGSFAAAAAWRRRGTTMLRGRRRWAFGGLLAVSLLSMIGLAATGWQARHEDWWFWGSSDLLFTLPFALVWLSLAVMVRRGQTGEHVESSSELRAFLLYACYATMTVLWLFPSADIWHVLPLLPSCLPLLAFLLERFWRLTGEENRSSRAWQIGAGALIGVFALVLSVPAAHDVIRERATKAPYAQWLPRATGVRGGSGVWESTRSGGKLVRYLTEEERRDDAIFVLSGKSLFYFLADRVSPVQEFEFVLYMIALELVSDERARELVDEDVLIRRLQVLRPLIVDDNFDAGSQNIRRTFPRLDHFISTHYQQETELGKFRVLRWNAKLD